MKIELMALITTVVIFIISSTSNSINVFIERKKKWYLDVVLAKNLDEINSFYKEILKKFKENKKEIDDAKLAGVDVSSLLILSARKKDELNEIKKKFTFQLLPIFKSYNQSFSSDLESNILSFQDIYTNALEWNSKIDNKVLIRELEDSKIEFYQLLYVPVNENLFLRTLFNRTLFKLLIAFFFSLGVLSSIFVIFKINFLLIIFEGKC